MEDRTDKSKFALDEKLKRMTGKQKVFNNVLFSMVDRLLVLFCYMLISIIVARRLGATDFGKYNYFIVVYGFVNSFSTFGMEQIVTKEFAANEDRQRLVFRAAVIVSVIAAALTELGVILLQIMTGFLTWLEVAALGAICFFNISSIFKYYMNAIYQIGSIVKIKNLLLILVVVLDGVLLIIKAPVEYFILAFALRECSIMGASLVAFVLSKEYVKLKRQLLVADNVFPMIRKLVQLCFPLLLTGLSVSIYMRIDQVMIIDMLDERQLGIYSAGIKLVEFFFNLPTAVITGLLPYFAEKYVHDLEVFWKRFEQLANGLNTCAYLFAIVIAALGKWIINFLYGEEYCDAVNVLAVYVWAVIPVAMGCVRGICLSVMEYSGLNFFFSVSAAAVNVILNLLLIPKHGIVGAAVASVVSYLLQGFVFSFFSPKLRRVAGIQARSLYGFVYIVRDMMMSCKEKRERNL